MMEIVNVIKEVRSKDHPELGEDEYVDYVLSHIVFTPCPNLRHAFVMRDGEVVGYTGEMMCEINIHLILAFVWCERVGIQADNPLLYLDCEAGAIKVKGDRSFMWQGKPTEVQVKKWIELLGETGIMLGEKDDRAYSLSQIKQMDLIMLGCHLRNE